MNRERCCSSMPTSWDEASVMQSASSTNTAESHMLLSSRETRGKARVLWTVARASRSITTSTSHNMDKQAAMSAADLQM